MCRPWTPPRPVRSYVWPPRKSERKRLVFWDWVIPSRRSWTWRVVVFFVLVLTLPLGLPLRLRCRGGCVQSHGQTLMSGMLPGVRAFPVQLHVVRKARLLSAVLCAPVLRAAQLRVVRAVVSWLVGGVFFARFPPSLL